jgi:hypothetical protein
MNVVPQNKRRKSLPSNYKFNNGFLSTPSSQYLPYPNKKNATDLDVLKFKDTKIHERLLEKLEKSRKQIIKDNDIYINKEHELLCYYNNKLIELKKKIKILNKHIEISYKDNILVNNSELETFIEKRKGGDIAVLDYKITLYRYNIKYNEYNKKFINKIQEYIDEKSLNKFIEKQNSFIESLNIRDIYNLKYYTYRGDIYLNYYIDNGGIFDTQVILDNGRGIVDDDSDLCYYFFQFLDYFKANNYKGQKVNVDDDMLFIKFIKDNYLDFNSDIYKFVFDLYINELKELFKKAPKTDNELVLYRGINENYILHNAKRGYYTTNHFSSTSLLPEFAYNYTKKKNIMLKIIVEKGVPLIFVEGITLAKGDFEVIMPIHSKLYIDYALKKVNYYKTKDDICPSINNDNQLKVSTIIYMK